MYTIIYIYIYIYIYTHTHTYIYIYTVYKCKTNNDIMYTGTSLNIKRDFYSLRQNKINSSRCILLKSQNFKLKTTCIGAPLCTLTHNHVQIIQTFLRSHSPSLTSHSPSCFRKELQLWSNCWAWWINGGYDIWLLKRGETGIKDYFLLHCSSYQKRRICLSWQWFYMA